MNLLGVISTSRLYKTIHRVVRHPITIPLLLYSVLFLCQQRRANSLSIVNNTSLKMHSLSPNLSSFAFKLFSDLVSSESSNVLISPISIGSALALALAGSTKDSIGERQIQQVLNIKSHSDVPMMSKQLMSSLSGINLVSANGIWTRSSIKPEYIQTVKNIHDAMVDKIPTTFDPINKFVEQKTNGMIKDLFEGDVDPLIVAILVNAVYFKGEWKKQFNKSNTSQGIFHSLQKDNSILQRQAMFMSDKRMVQYGMYLESLRGAKGVLLEYGSQDVEAKFGAALFLPPENTIQSMTNLIADISALVGKDDKTGIKAMSLNTFIQSEFDSGSVIVKLPRFRLSFGAKSLLTSLKRLGITAPFERNGMFKLMSNDEQVHIDDVLHKASIEVTEEGTVAAAGSGAVMMTRSLPTMITFDRPFIMIIYHLETGLPMFIGKIDDPEFI